MGPIRGPANREAAEGLATGALFMALFGAVWAATGAGALGGAAGAVVLVVSIALVVALCLGSVRVRRGVRDLPRDGSPRARAHLGRLSRWFNLVFFLQSLAIALAVVLLIRYGLETLVPVAVALIVGVHFFPLAALYGIRAYHVTGAALCAVALVAFFMAPTARLPVLALGSAAALFATCAYLLSLGGEAKRSGTPSA